MKIAFLVPSLRLSGGLNVVVEHGSRLVRYHGFDVTLVITHHQGEAHWPYPGLAELQVVEIEHARSQQYDLCLATWWDTVVHLCDVPAKRVGYFVQSLEDRFFTSDDPQSQLAGLTYRMGLPVVTEAAWIAEIFTELDPQLPCFYVRNGINKDIFPVADRVPDRMEGPLRILIEGNPDDPIKGVPEALDAVRMMEAPATVTVVAAKARQADGFPVVGPLSQSELSALMAETDVLLKLSRVEGMSGPPLEGFHRGATAVLTPVTGHDEYARHGWNCLVTGWDDIRGTARHLDLLAGDPSLLARLRANALLTARSWPSWDEAAAEMAVALRSMAESPGPEVAHLAPLLRDARYHIARASRVRHRFKVKAAADAAHIDKLDTALLRESERASRLDARATAMGARLDQMGAELAVLERSRWLRVADLLQRLARRGHGGPTLRSSIAEIGRRARDPMSG